jgi:hypothetical protein
LKPNNPNYGYGVHAQPVKEAFDKLGIKSEVLTDDPSAFEKIVAAVGEGKTAIVWVFSIWYGVPFSPDYVSRETDNEGHEYKLMKGEHVMLARGVSADGKKLLLNDPYAAKAFWKSKDDLVNLEWDEFGYMTLIIGD